MEFFTWQTPLPSLLHNNRTFVNIKKRNSIERTAMENVDVFPSFFSFYGLHIYWKAVEDAFLFNYGCHHNLHLIVIKVVEADEDWGLLRRSFCFLVKSLDEAEEGRPSSRRFAVKSFQLLLTQQHSNQLWIAPACFLIIGSIGKT